MGRRKANKEKKPTLIDLFCGCGGASLGFIRKGFKIVAALDKDPKAVETYSHNIGIRPLVGHIENARGKEILKATGLKKGEPTVLIGCPPCQGFTIHRGKAGRRDRRNGLVEVYIERVKEIMPLFVVFENVPGILRDHGKKHFELFLERLDDLGYTAVWDVLQAADYGVPQLRKRVVAIASRDKSLKLRLPEATHAKNPASGRKSWRTVRDAIGDLPPLRSGESSPAVPNHVVPNHSPRILKLIQHIPKDGGSRCDLPRRLRLKCHLRHNGHRDVYGRMRWDAPAPTLTYGCTNPSRGRFIHPEQDRAITPREAARLQSFPDDFIFHSAPTHAATHIGNAVPILLAQKIGGVIMRLLQ